MLKINNWRTNFS